MALYFLRCCCLEKSPYGVNLEPTFAYAGVVMDGASGNPVAYKAKLNVKKRNWSLENIPLAG